MLARLPTLDSRSMGNHPNICPLCMSHPESHDHIFLNCCFTSLIWRFIKDRCQFYTSITNWEELIQYISVRWKAKSVPNLLRKVCFSAMMYHTWEERNKRIFKKKKSSQKVVLARICSTITTILMLGFLQDCSTARKILSEWNLSLSCCRPPPRPPDTTNRRLNAGA
ncbi:uncharacterized protein LOC132301114 [Cornus florida]|uniref:uncharacterized protein LOC132301114 n=1 Tax=Cornus florida TaxID=4283 RepID=UPI00289F041F|nr:uncharacterized protein LOC132301114 [Cornus florida]